MIWGLSGLRKQISRNLESYLLNPPTSLSHTHNLSPFISSYSLHSSRHVPRQLLRLARRKCHYRKRGSRPLRAIPESGRVRLQLLRPTQSTPSSYGSFLSGLLSCLLSRRICGDTERAFHLSCYTSRWPPFCVASPTHRQWNMQLSDFSACSVACPGSPQRFGSARWSQHLSSLWIFSRSPPNWPWYDRHLLEYSTGDVHRRT